MNNAFNLRFVQLEVILCCVENVIHNLTTISFRNLCLLHTIDYKVCLMYALPPVDVIQLFIFSYFAAPAQHTLLRSSVC